MASLNKIMIIGNVAKDPDVRMAGNTKVANFSLAVNEKFKDRSGEQQEKTEWVNAVVWGNQADIVEKYVKKGSSLYIEGKLETREWEKDGKKGRSTEVRVINFQMLGGRSTETQAYQPKQESAPRQDSFRSMPDFEEDNLPF